MEWKTYSIAEIGEVVGGGTPSTSNSEFWGGDIPWITPKDLTGYYQIYISHGASIVKAPNINNISKIARI